MALTVFWFAVWRKGICIRPIWTSASLILMGDWCSKADTKHNEDLRCGKEMVADAFDTQKTLFAHRIIMRS